MRCGAKESMPDENLQILRLSTLINFRNALDPGKWQMANGKCEENTAFNLKEIYG